MIICNNNNNVNYVINNNASCANTANMKIVKTDLKCTHHEKEVTELMEMLMSFIISNHFIMCTYIETSLCAS
jgi:hypothetical protein